MSVKPTSLLLACCTAVLGMAGALAQPAAEPALDTLQPYADPDGYALYARYMQQRVPGPHVRFVEARTLPPDDCVAPQGPLADKIAEAVADSRTRNAQRLRLTDAFPPTVAVKLLTPDEAVAHLWTERPNLTDQLAQTLAVARFSAVGFSHDRSVAVMRAGFITGPSGGDIGSHVYVREAAGWREVPGQRRCSIVI